MSQYADVLVHLYKEEGEEGNMATFRATSVPTVGEEVVMVDHRYIPGVTDKFVVESRRWVLYRHTENSSDLEVEIKLKPKL